MQNFKVHELTRRNIHRSTEDVTRSPTSSTENEDDVDVENEDECDSLSLSPNKNLYPCVDKSFEISYDSEVSSYINSSRNTSGISLDRSDTTHERSSTWGMILMVLVGLIAAVMCTIFCFGYINQNSAETVDSKIAELKSNFPNISTLTFRVIKAALKNVVSDAAVPRAPAILLLAGVSGARNKVCDFSEALVTLFHNNPLKIEGDYWKQYDPNSAKEGIDDQLKKSFKENQLNAVTINDLELIPSKAAMLLHSYCDHENAPFKKSIIVMTITSHENIPIDAESKLMDKFAADVLRETWRDMNADQLESLLSRITVSVAVVH